MLLGVIPAIACGSRDSGERASRGASGPEAAEQAVEPLPALTPQPLGKPALTGYAYSRGPGREPFKQAVAANRRTDWAAVVEHCRAALSRDPGHLEAQWYLATALARQEQYSAVAAPLSAAVSGDWMRWGERSLRARALAGFRESRHGRQYVELAQQYRQRFRTIASSGLLVVGRRGKPWNSDHRGAVLVNHRSEIYVYDTETARYLRVSRTNGSLVGFIRKPDAMELAYVSYRKAWTPPRAGDSSTGDSQAAPARIRELRIGTVDLDVGAMSRHEVVLEDVVELELGYQIIEQAGEARPTLIARVRSPDEAGIAIYQVDIEAGRAHRLDATGLPPSGQRLRVGYRFAELRRIPIPRVTADWDDDGAAGSFRLDQTRKTITLASGLQVNGHTMTWSPARTRLAFTTMADEPCSGDQSGRMVILYATDAATGKLREVTRGPGPLAPVWLDEQRVAYTDRTERSPAVTIADVLSPDARDRLTTRGGLSTHHLAEEPSCLPDSSRDDESR